MTSGRGSCATLPSARLELADVLGRHAEDYIRHHDGHLGRVERRVMSAIMACRTAILGGHVETCTACRASRIAYNSCRNRHCPKCQGPARTRWLAARERELLPVPYFHVVFTVPAPVGAIAFQNKAVVYTILFKAAAEALTTLAANPRRLGAEIGAVAVLHTWGQALTHHPHLHCVVPGGGLAPDGARWVHGRANFFLAVKPLARLFRRLFLERLAAAFDQGELRFFGDLATLADRNNFAGDLATLRRSNWVVYAKKPFGGPAQVLAYLGRYTHRVAIANSRLVSCDQDHVAFTWKDYRRNGAVRVMRLTRTSSFGASSSTPCPMASIASATSASSPTAIGPPSSRSPARSLRPWTRPNLPTRRPLPRPPRAPTRRPLTALLQPARSAVASFA